MAKLTEKQVKVLQYTLKYGRIHIHDAIMSVGRGSNLPGTINALVKRGYLKEDYPSLYYLLTDEGYAIAQPAAAPTVNAEPWTPSEYVYRTTARPAWRGETVPAEGFIRSYSANHAVWAAADCAVYDRPLSANEQSRYELVPVSENAYAFAIGERVVYIETDEDYTVSEHIDGRYHLTHENGVRAEYVREDKLAEANPAASANAAGVWTPAVGMLVRFKEGVILYGDNRDVDDLQAQRIVGKITRMDDGIAVDFGLDGSYVCFADELEPAVSADTVNAAGVGEVADEMERFFTMSDAQKFSELINQADVIRKNDAQIAALTRDLADAVAERDALRKRIAFMRRDAHFMVKTQYALDRHEIDAAFESIMAFADGRHPELSMPDPADAAMVAALRSRDNGNRTPADNVLAMFADGEDGTIA